jgi:hypothetical protein
VKVTNAMNTLSDFPPRLVCVRHFTSPLHHLIHTVSMTDKMSIWLLYSKIFSNYAIGIGVIAFSVGILYAGRGISSIGESSKLFEAYAIKHDDALQKVATAAVKTASALKKIASAAVCVR